MPKKSFKEIGSEAARAFITIEPSATDVPRLTPTEEKTITEVECPSIRVGRPRVNHRAVTKSSQENLPENWTRATFIVREDILSAFKKQSAREGVTIKEAVNTALRQYLDGGKRHD